MAIIIHMLYTLYFVYFLFNLYNCKPWSLSELTPYQINSPRLGRLQLFNIGLLKSRIHFIKEKKVWISHQTKNWLIFIGTESQILTPRPKDTSKSGFYHWNFMSVHFWGEDSRGVWTVAIFNDFNQSGKVIDLQLILYGT